MRDRRIFDFGTKISLEFFVLLLAAVVASLPATSYAGPSLTSLEEEIESIVNNGKTCIVTVSSQYDIRPGNAPVSPFEKFGLRVDSRNSVVRQSIGSGIVFYREIVVTSGSVVRSGRDVKVVFQDGQTFNATVVGIDKNANVCVLRVTGLKAKPVTLGASNSVRIGSLVVLMGNSFGKLPTVALGTVSGRQKVSRIQGKWETIQITGPLHPGNSGAAVLNTEGELVAMVVGRIVGDLGSGAGPGTGDASLQIEALPSGPGSGVGLALPVESVRRVVDALLKNGYVACGYLGVKTQTYSSGGPITRIGLSSAPGVEISEVVPNSPAAKAGLRSGDVLSEFDDEPVVEAAQLSQMVSATMPGEKVKVAFWRGSQRLIAVVAIGSAGPPRDEAQTGINSKSSPKGESRALSTQ